MDIDIFASIFQSDLLPRLSAADAALLKKKVEEARAARKEAARKEKEVADLLGGWDL